MPSPAAKHNLFWLVVHGSFGPGGNDHARLADLAGQWQPGSFAAVAGDQFSDLVVMRYSEEVVPGWAIQIATKPSKPEDASAADGNTPSQLYETWERIDRLFGDNVARMDTTFQFETSQPGEGDVCRANTYGSLTMIPEGRYDAPHPAAGLVDLWNHVVVDQKNYEPSQFEGLINTLAPQDYGQTFEAVPGHQGFVERLNRLDGEGPLREKSRAGVNDQALLGLARAALQTRSEAIHSHVGADWDENQMLLDNVQYQILTGDERPELGDLHYDLSEGFADAAGFTTPTNWTSCLAHACYAIAGSYDLAYWLTQDWRQTSVDLEPLYALWVAGGEVAVDTAGVAHVSRTDPR